MKQFHEIILHMSAQYLGYSFIPPYSVVGASVHKKYIAATTHSGR